MRDGFVGHTIEGALGGAIGTIFIQKSMQLSARLPERLQPTQTQRDPGDFIVSRVEDLRHRPMPRLVHDRLAGGLHWAYGIGWGSLLGLTTARRHILTLPSALVSGAALGTVVWAVGYAGWLPAAKLAPPLSRQGARHALTTLLSHVGYGLFTSVPVYLLDRYVRREPWYTRLYRRFF